MALRGGKGTHKRANMALQVPTWGHKKAKWSERERRESPTFASSDWKIGPSSFPVAGWNCGAVKGPTREPKWAIGYQHGANARHNGATASASNHLISLPVTGK